ncbi:MAG TPA: peptidase S8, partial [Actinomycetota bacterium]|nr:peptidase S8 [Actinomycetota bacterium]
MRAPRLRRSWIPLTAAASALAAVVALVAAPGAAGAATTPVWTAAPMCAAATPGHRACHGLRLVRATPAQAARLGTVASVARPALADGPAGGYAPTDLAKAYGLNVNAPAAASQTVAIIDAFDDPSVKTDLAVFDTQNGIAAETGTSFRVVNQDGNASPLPTADTGWAGEITLDVQAVRGICRRCKILLVEADSASDTDLATAVNT